MREMEAGRELDALIAEKVMGWKWIVTIPGAHEAHGMTMGDWTKQTMGMRYLRSTAKQYSFLQRPADGTEPKASLDVDTCAIFPRYSTSIAAAWEVVAVMSARGFTFSLQVGVLGVSRVLFSRGTPLEDDGPDQVVPLVEVPLAICLAALKAVDINA